MMSTSSLLLSLVLLVQSIAIASSFAVSSSSSPKRKTVSNQGKAAGGFAKKAPDSVPISHTRDESPSTQNLINFLLQWKSEGVGGPDAGTEVGFDIDNGVRGMYATKPFKKNEIVCKIPSDVALALVDPNSATEESMNPADGALNFLRWYQNNEQARQTWSAYLDTLPTREAHFDPSPDFYSDAEIEQLEFPMVVEKVNERKNEILALSESESIPFDELQFAAWLVSSRSFAIKMMVDDPLVREDVRKIKALEKSIRLLLPYLDMINHSSDKANAELHLIDPEKDEAWFSIRAARPIKKGQEITIPYGAAGLETSVSLLMNYGFVPDENRIDSMMLGNGGEGCIESVDGWSTTLEEDEAQLSQASGNMINVLKLRTKLKRSYPSESD
eukprot:CAMPEP_0172310220 /NCGR_PEP_ID=MMETSP1058-20130122/11357_1 /TAXON_ID=83371 /ORGANISM="Detonula confervacea, Strain CCMP 353" /LENGTH=386 /DNA_ID=CAMNT_0013022991 /DNA_START=84 /DNA_END=1244 /DNA_ORIENTATION=+